MEPKWNYWYALYREPGATIVVTALGLGALAGIVALVCNALAR